MVEVKIKRSSSKSQIPKRMTESASGADLFARLDDPVQIDAGSLALIPTGVSLEVPCGFEVQIRPRSGLALNYKIGILNSPGTIDADYRGQVMVILFNFGTKVFIVENDMRIAQMVVAKVESVTFLEVETLSNTLRLDGGFGHTKI